MQSFIVLIGVYILFVLALGIFIPDANKAIIAGLLMTVSIYLFVMYECLNILVVGSGVCTNQSSLYDYLQTGLEAVGAVWLTAEIVKMVVVGVKKAVNQ